MSRTGLRTDHPARRFVQARGGVAWARVMLGPGARSSTRLASGSVPHLAELAGGVSARTTLFLNRTFQRDSPKCASNEQCGPIGLLHEVSDTGCDAELCEVRGW